MLEAAAYFALACLTLAGAAVVCYAGTEAVGRALDWWLDRQEKR